MDVGEDRLPLPVFVVDLYRAEVESHGSVDAGLGLEFAGNLGVDSSEVGTGGGMVVFAAGRPCKGVHRLPCGAFLTNTVRERYHVQPDVVVLRVDGHILVRVQAAICLF